MEQIFKLGQWIDDRFIYLINNKMKNRILDVFFPIFTQLAGLGVLIPGIVIGIILPEDPYFKRFVLSLGLTQLMVAAIVHLVKHLSYRDRPYDSCEGINDMGYRLLDKSFPSGHTAAAFTVYYFVSIYYPQYSFIFCLYGVFIAISRVYLGVHYPTDTLGGFLVAMLTSWLAYNYVLPVILPGILDYLS